MNEEERIQDLVKQIEELDRQLVELEQKQTDIEFAQMDNRRQRSQLLKQLPANEQLKLLLP